MSKHIHDNEICPFNSSGIVPATSVLLDVYWKDVDGDSEWVKCLMCYFNPLSVDHLHPHLGAIYRLGHELFLFIHRLGQLKVLMELRKDMTAQEMMYYLFLPTTL